MTQESQGSGRSRFQLSNEQWTDLKKKSGLVDDAREEVEEVIRFLRLRPALRQKHPLLIELQTARCEIAAVRKTLRPALEGVGALARSPARAYIRLPVGPSPSKSNLSETVPIETPDIPKLHHDLQTLDQALKYSILAMPNDRDSARRKKEHLHIAIESLNSVVLEHTGRLLSQAKKKTKDELDLKQFVIDVCRIAQPGINDKTVVKHLKNVRAEAVRGGLGT
jgi:hypothetical protein